MARKKVAILRAGTAAMTAAFELTRPGLPDEYDVTVYQLGWRLGGKGASGRNATVAERIEEHGLHIWMGFYDNAFQVMQEAYAELARPAGPLQTWEDAFKQHSYIVLGEPLGGTEYFWQINMPTNGEVPGAAQAESAEPSLAEMTALVVAWLEDHWWKAPVRRPEPPRPFPPHIEALVARATASEGNASPSRRRYGCLAQGTFCPALAEADARDQASACFARARLLTNAVAAKNGAPSEAEARAIAELLEEGIACARAHIGDDPTVSFPLFQLWVGLHLAGAAAIGILRDDIIVKGWDSIDDLDLRAWLAKYGADPATLGSGPLRGVYDLVFGYVDGDISQPAFAAGTAMRGMLRMIFLYKGAIFYKMQAGMGDTVFTPLYQVLKRRGVRFEFFHKVTDVCVDVETKRSSSIAR